MTDQDHSYKHLFSHHRMVEDLLRGFVREDWVQQLDFSTLEKVSGSYVSDDLRARVMTYLGLLYQDLIASHQLTPARRLPPVLPVVLYNGEPRWTAAEDIAELVEAIPGGLERYRPQLRYLLLDEGRYREEELPPLKNLVAAVFRLENSRTPADVLKILTALIEWLQEPEQNTLRRSFTVWLKRVLLPKRLPQVSFPELTELHEVRTMLAERVKEWTKEWREQGLEEGRKEGRKEGEVLILVRLLERKFGPLSDEHRRRLKAADSDILLEWSERVLTAEHVTEVLGE